MDMSSGSLRPPRADKEKKKKMLSKVAMNKFKIQQGFELIVKRLRKRELQIYSIKLTNLRKFSTNPFRADKDEEVLKIETHPYLYIDILTNEYQQKVLAKKLMIPEDFVHKYFQYFNKFKSVGDSAPSMTNSFDPKNFTKDTPVTVVKEYLKIIEDGLKQAYLEHGDNKEISNLFLKPFDVNASQKHFKDMPKFLGYEKSELTERDKTEIEYEKDVFQMKLNANEEALVDKIIEQMTRSRSSSNPLINEDTFITDRVPSQKETAAVGYVLADLTLRDKSASQFVQTGIASLIKKEGLKQLKREEDPEYIKQSNNEMQESNFINNTLAEKIMIKRKILQNKLQMIEQTNKAYQSKASLDLLNNSINSRNSINFIEAFEANKQAQNSEIKRYKGRDGKMQRMDTIVLMLKNGSTDEVLFKEYEALSAEIKPRFSANLNYCIMNVEYGIASNNAAFAVKSFEELIQTGNIVEHNGSVKSFIPADSQILKQLYELCLQRDNFKGLALIINYAEQRKIKISSFDLNLFKDSLEYYMNNQLSLSNIIIFLKYYTYFQECLFRDFNLTPQKIRNLSQSELVEYSNLLFPYNNLADTRDIFSFIVKKIGSNRIIDNTTKQNMMERFVNYFANYTAPFMDATNYSNNFILENDVALYCANRFEEPNSFNTVIDLCVKYGDRTILHDFILDHLKRYQLSNPNKVPYSYTKANIINKLNELALKTKEDSFFSINPKLFEIFLHLMSNHNMIKEMSRIPSPMKNYYITESILTQKSDGSSDFFSSQIKKLFESKEDQQSSLYSLCMIKALLKEGDIDSALRVLDEGERSLNGRKKAIEKYYLKVYDYCINSEDPEVKHVSFFPDLLSEREKRISTELDNAGERSAYDKQKLSERYSKVDLSKNLPVSYSDFKKKHFNLVKTIKNYTQQMMVMKMIKSSIDDCDYKKINDLFNYLLINKEEEQIRKSIREKIEKFEKFFNPNTQLPTLEESKDPLYVLFKYVKRPGDDIDALINKYILLVPDVHSKIDKLRERKEYLHNTVKGFIKEKDALYLTDSNIDKLKYLDKDHLKEIQQLRFDTNNQKATEAISKLSKYYEAIMSDQTQEEMKYDLTEEQLNKARAKHFYNPESNYSKILEEAKRDHGVSFEDRAENILVDLKDAASDPEFAKEFHESVLKGKNKIAKNEFFSTLLNSDLINSLRSEAKQVDPSNSLTNSGNSFKTIFNDSLSNYYSAEPSDKPGFSKFVNHSNGEVLIVNDSKMATDSQYFTKTVADLARLHMSNIQLSENAKQKELSGILNSLMKSREYRKFYYFTRKFYYMKFEEDVKNGFIKIDEFGNLSYSKNYQSKTRNSEDDKQDRVDTGLHISEVFIQPKFDVADFKKYFPKDEYESLVREYYNFTRGSTPEEKFEFLKEKLLGQKASEEAKKVIDEKLTNLYNKLGIKPGSEENPSQLFGKITPEVNAHLSNFSKQERDDRINLFEKKYKDELITSWNEYKIKKLNEYMKTQKKLVNQDSQRISFENLKNENLSLALNDIDEINSLIDVATTPLDTAGISQDHLAFEAFDYAINSGDLEYTKYQDEREKQIYGDDQYNKGYKNPRQMSDFYEDIYDLDDPNFKRQIFRHSEKSYRDVLDNRRNIKRKGEEDDKSDPKVQYFDKKEPTPESESVKADIIVDRFKDNIEKFEKDKMRYYKQDIDPINDEPKIILRDVESINYATIKNPESFVKRMNAHQELSLPGKSSNPGDLYNIQEEAFNKSFSNMHSDLEYAIQKRKELANSDFDSSFEQAEKAMNIAMNIYNKIQNIEMSGIKTLDSTPLNDEHLFVRDSTKEQLRDELARLKISLDDSTSPSISVIKQLHSQGLIGLDNSKLEEIVNASPEMLNEATEKLEKIYSELENKEKIMIALQNAYESKLNEYAQLEASNKDFSREKDEKIKAMLEKEIFEAYIEYQRDLLKSADKEVSQQNLDFSDQHKIEFVRKIFGVMEPRQLDNFGADLLQFGITQNIPDAVRLGESIAGLNKENVSEELEKMLKQYTLDNSERLRERIQFTGPMKGIIKNRKENLMRKEDREAYIPVNYADLHKKYNDRYNQWRLPSAMAEDHSEYGVYGAIFGKEKLKKISEFVKE